MTVLSGGDVLQRQRYIIVTLDKVHQIQKPLFCFNLAIKTFEKVMVKGASHILLYI